ncbi:MAG: hypothetical protein ACLGIG_07900, partial [Actinomycetes bacterium]
DAWNPRMAWAAWSTARTMTSRASRGWSREQIENPEPGPALPLPVAAADVAALASFGTHEAGATVLMHGGGTASGTARAVQDLLAGASAAATEREAAAAAVRAVAAQIGSVQRGG